MTGESNLAIKKSYIECLGHHNEEKVNPFLFSGTNCVEGSGSMLVLAVGQNSLIGRILRQVNEEENTSPLPLQM
jgi:magnesium-transporting ATPase (P-type)